MMAKPDAGAGEAPLVTVAVGCYNHARFVVSALESVRAQTYPRIQLIIWDDNSRDNSAAVIREWIGANGVECTFLAHARNYGVCRSLNEALGLAQGKYFAFVAADDIWLPEKTARQVAMLEGLPEDFGLVYSDAYQMNEAGELLPERFIETWRSEPSRPEGWVFDELLESDFIPAMSTLIRRSCLAAVGNYDERLCFEDWDMWIRLARRFRFAYSPEPSAKYRIVGTSMMRTRSKQMEDSIARMWIKFLGQGMLNQGQRGEIIDRLQRYLVSGYARGEKMRVSYAAQLWRHRPRALMLVLWMCLALRVPFSGFQRIGAGGAWLKQWARRISMAGLKQSDSN